MVGGVVGDDRSVVGHAAVVPQPPHIWGCTVVGDHPLLLPFYSCNQQHKVSKCST